jgi:hypothetical protein
MALVLKLQPASKSPGKLVKMDFWAPLLMMDMLSGFEGDSRICILIISQVMLGLLSQGPHIIRPALECLNNNTTVNTYPELILCQALCQEELYIVSLHSLKILSCL